MLVLSCKEQLKHDVRITQFLRLFSAWAMVQMFATLHDHHTSCPSYAQASNDDNAADLHQLASFISCAEQSCAEQA
jgi:hypothetical protein